MDAPNYRLCDTTVTVYRQVSEGNYRRTLYTRAFIDFRKNRNIDKTGSRDGNSFLLVLPNFANDFTLSTLVPGDRVFWGIGPEISDRAEWNEFIPSKVPGLVVIKYVDPKLYRGRITHIEAGG